MDRGSGRPTGGEVGFHQINGVTHYLDSEGNWFLLDATSGEWLLCAQPVQQDHAALFGDTWNGAMSPLPGNGRGSNRSGRHQGQGSVRPPNAQVMTGGSDSRPGVYQSQQRGFADPFVSGTTIVVDHAGNEPGAEELNPSSTNANPGSWDSIAEGTTHERGDAGTIATRGVPNHGYHDFVQFVSSSRDSSEGSRSVAFVDRCFPSDGRSRQRSGNPAPTYPATVVLSSDSSSSESGSQGSCPKSKSKSKPKDKSTKGAQSKKRR